MSKNPYVILGVKENATQEQIKKAYRGLAKKHHPDLNPGNKQNEAKFKEISHAYDQIGTPEARAKFDRGETDENAFNQGRQNKEWSSYYNTQQNSGRYSQSFADSFGDEDLFEQIFGRSRSGKGSRTRPHVNEDIHYQMNITFRESILGAEKVITLANGKNLSIKIPAGIENGKKLRFKGQGNQDYTDAPAGDAYIQINVQEEKGWTRKGDDIEMELPVSFFEAVLGAEVSVPTLHGQVMLKIPSGVSTGTKMRIKGKGVLTEGRQGNQIVHLKVMAPKNPDHELMEELRKLQSRFSYNPRESNADAQSRGPFGGAP